MSRKETAVRENGAASKHRIRPRGRARAMLCAASLALLALFAFPALAAAITSTPLLAGVSATPTSSGRHPERHRLPLRAGHPLPLRIRHHRRAYGTNVPMPDADAGSAAYPDHGAGAADDLRPVTGHHLPLPPRRLQLGRHRHDLEPTRPSRPPATPPTVAADAGDRSRRAASTERHRQPATARPPPIDSNTERRPGYGTNIPDPRSSVGSGSSAVPVRQDVTGAAAEHDLPFPPRRPQQRHAAIHRRPDLHDAAQRAPAPPSAVVSAPSQDRRRLQTRGRDQPEQRRTRIPLRVRPDDRATGQNLPATDADIGAGRERGPGQPGSHRPGTEHDLPLPGRRAQRRRHGNSLDQTFTTAAQPAGRGIAAGQPNRRRVHPQRHRQPERGATRPTTSNSGSPRPTAAASRRPKPTPAAGAVAGLRLPAGHGAAAGSPLPLPPRRPQRRRHHDGRRRVLHDARRDPSISAPSRTRCRRPRPRGAARLWFRRRTGSRWDRPPPRAERRR